MTHKPLTYINKIDILCTDITKRAFKMSKKVLPVLWTYSVEEYGFEVHWKKYSSLIADKFSTDHWKKDVASSFTLQEQYDQVETYCKENSLEILRPVYASVDPDVENEEEITGLFYEALSISLEHGYQVAFVNMGEKALREGIIESNGERGQFKHLDEIKKRALYEITNYHREMPHSGIEELMEHTGRIIMLNGNQNLAYRFYEAYKCFLDRKITKKKKAERAKPTKLKRKSKYKQSTKKILSRVRMEYLNDIEERVLIIFEKHRGKHRKQHTAHEEIANDFHKALIPPQLARTRNQDYFEHSPDTVRRILEDLGIHGDLMKPKKK